MLEKSDPRRREIHSGVDRFVEGLADRMAIPAETVALLVFSRVQTHRKWGRNATKDQKDLAFETHGGACFRYRKPLGRSKAIFHHNRELRRTPEQHSPANLVPLCMACHDDEHGAKRASLAKGAPVRGRR